MADQAERVILEAEDQLSTVVDKANAGLDSFEKKAESWSQDQSTRTSSPLPRRCRTRGVPSSRSESSTGLPTRSETLLTAEK